MKRLLSLVAVIALVASMAPGTGIAGLRGAFDPLGRSVGAGLDGIDYKNGLPNGQQTPAVRPMPIGAAEGVALRERWVSWTTRDQVVGFESSREIWQLLNRTNANLANTTPNSRSRILGDPTGVVSYLDPSWSPNGRFLAYTQANSQVTQASIYVQEFAASTSMTTAITPIGSPILVVSGGVSTRNRHPDWSPDGNSLAYDSDASGSIDVYTVQVFPTVGSPVQHTFLANRAEQNPAYAPDGVRIAYDTNRFGPNIIEIVDTSTNAVTAAETNFVSVSHSNPDWSSDGNSIYYDAPENEDPQKNQDIWKLDLPTQAKCAIHLDGSGDVNVTVSPALNHTNDGVPFNDIWFESQALGLGLIIWRGNYVQSCVPPLPMAVDISPSSLNFGSGGDITVGMTFPIETWNAGYGCTDINQVGHEGVRLRAAGLIPSPTVLGIGAPTDPHGPTAGLPAYTTTGNNGPTAKINVKFGRRNLEDRLVALGLVNQSVLVEVDAYSNIVGRQFRGFGMINISTSSLASSAVRLEQNSPNPFNPTTKIRFAVSKPGNVALRVYNVKGELVKTIADQHFEAGMHDVSWNGRNSGGNQVGSGVYYAKVSAAGGATDVIKMVMAK